MVISRIICQYPSVFYLDYGLCIWMKNNYFLCYGSNKTTSLFRWCHEFKIQSCNNEMDSRNLPIYKILFRFVLHLPFMNEPHNNSISLYSFTLTDLFCSLVRHVKQNWCNPKKNFTAKWRVMSNSLFTFLARDCLGNSSRDVNIYTRGRP